MDGDGRPVRTKIRSLALGERVADHSGRASGHSLQGVHLNIVSVVAVNFINLSLFPDFKRDAQDEIGEVGLGAVLFARVVAVGACSG